MSLSGSTKKIILDLSQWKKAMTLRVLSPDLLDSLKLFKVDFLFKKLDIESYFSCLEGRRS